jgi:predicted dehydrogenase
VSYRVAVVGAGEWGLNLIRTFHRPPASHVAWVVDLDDERLAGVRERWPDVAVHQDIDAVLDECLDAVVVATPSSTHYAFARRALEAGRHVFVEKPITTSSREAGELCSIAEARHLVLMVGHVFLYNAGIQFVKHQLADDCLGRILYLAMVRTNLGPVRTDVNASWDLASHDISIANYWLDASPLSVTAASGGWINADIEDVVFATLHYPDGVIAHIHASWLSPLKNRDITVVGEHRMLIFDDLNLSEPVRIYDAAIADALSGPSLTRSTVRTGPVSAPGVALQEPLLAEADHFLACIREGRQPLTSGRQGLGVVRVLEAIDRSLANGGREEPVISDFV